MKLLTQLLEMMAEPAISKESIQAALWSSYKNDPIIPPDEDDPYHMNDDDFADFMKHIEDVYKFAVSNKITDPEEAIEQYSSGLEKRLFPGYYSKH
jgi:hypothetical protein